MYDAFQFNTHNITRMALFFYLLLISGGSIKSKVILCWKHEIYKFRSNCFALSSFMHHMFNQKVKHGSLPAVRIGQATYIGHFITNDGYQSKM